MDAEIYTFILYVCAIDFQVFNVGVLLYGFSCMVTKAVDLV